MRLSRLFDEVSEELDIDISIVENVIKYVFSYIRNQIRDLTGVNILIHHFGTFAIKNHNIEKYTDMLEKMYNKGTLDRRKYKNHKENIKKLKSIVKKIKINESTKR